MISKRAQEVLQYMVAAEENVDLEAAEIVREGGSVWVGDERCSSRTLNELLRWCLVSDCSFGSVERYRLNENGIKAAADRTYVPPEMLGRKRV